MTNRIVFLFNLLQDVNILRPLVLLARRETDREILMLVSKGFRARDRTGSWQTELKVLCKIADVIERDYASPAEAYAALQGGKGVIFAGSESDLSAHRETHDVFRTAPAGYLRITLQHGLECVGFRQTVEHIIRHGRNVGFGADIICAWQSPERLTAMKPSERGKVRVTGPTSLLNVSVSGERRSSEDMGLICENLHSVRLQASAAHDKPFMATFREFCAVEEREGRNVALRPHPGGQYVVRNKVPLPQNVILDNLPIYRTDLSAYAFGISAPSTIVFDMVLAGIPTAVWRDHEGTIDARGYDGLTPVSTLDDWLAFVRDVRLRPDLLLRRQARWLKGLDVQLDPTETYRNFARLVAYRV